MTRSFAISLMSNSLPDFEESSNINTGSNGRGNPPWLNDQAPRDIGNTRTIGADNMNRMKGTNEPHKQVGNLLARGKNQDEQSQGRRGNDQTQLDSKAKTSSQD